MKGKKIERAKFLLGVRTSPQPPPTDTREAMESKYNGCFEALRKCAVVASSSIRYPQWSINMSDAHWDADEDDGCVTFVGLNDELEAPLTALTGAEWEAFAESFVLLGISAEALPRFLELARKAFDMSEEDVAECRRGLAEVTLNVDCSADFDLSMFHYYLGCNVNTDVDGEFIEPDSEDEDDMRAYEDCKEFDANFKQMEALTTGFRAEAREVIRERMATRIQSAFRGWQARMTYRWDVHNGLGRYLVMKDFEELVAC